MIQEKDKMQNVIDLIYSVVEADIQKRKNETDINQGHKSKNKFDDDIERISRINQGPDTKKVVSNRSHKDEVESLDQLLRRNARVNPGVDLQRERKRDQDSDVESSRFDGLSTCSSNDIIEEIRAFVNDLQTHVKREMVEELKEITYELRREVDELRGTARSWARSRTMQELKRQVKKDKKSIKKPKARGAGGEEVVNC